MACSSSFYIKCIAGRSPITGVIMAETYQSLRDKFDCDVGDSDLGI
jgi:hypothetical protein